VYKIFLQISDKADQIKDFSLLVQYGGLHVPVIQLERHSLHRDSIVGRISLIPYLSDWDLNALFKHKRERSENYKVLFNLFREEAQGDFIFLLDNSEYMTERRLLIAKKCLKFLLRNIPPKIKFNLITFAEGSSSLYPEPVVSSQENIWVAIASLTAVQPTKQGKNLTGILNSVLRKDDGLVGGPRFVFLLTDGWVTEEQSILHLVRTRSPFNKIFPLGTQWYI
jgi:hypothetical protein